MKRNSELLTKKSKKKPVKVSKPVVFDEKAREEYLTGFRKRKLEKKKSAKERYDKIVREEKCKRRAEKRQRLKTVIDSMVERMDQDKKLAEPAQIETEILEFVHDDVKTTVIAEPLEL